MGIAINEDIIDEIKTRASIVDVIGRYVSLKRAGNNYKGLCPFHNEKTPSFVVSDDKQIFTCFGCGARGDVIEFVKKVDNLDFIEAVEKLANDCGIEIQENSSYKDEEQKNKLYEINRKAARFFYDNFNETDNPGRKYMISRGLDESTLKKFGIGYAKDGWDTFVKFFEKEAEKVEPKLLSEVGLVGIKDKRVYDKFRNRVVFPIINTRGKVIGFGGRSIDEQMPKYLNSPESTIFHKKYNLFGLNIVRQEIRKKNYLILVEGYMDVISLYQHDVKNAVASLGTALTINQAKMIKRYAENVIIAYDSDEAGQNATLRAIDLLEEVDCKIKVLQLESKAKDPDEFIKEFGKEEFVKMLKKSISYIDFKINVLRKAHDISIPEEKIEFVKKVTEELGKIKSHIEVDYYIKKISEETEIHESAILKELQEKYSNTNVKKEKDTIREKKVEKEKSWKNDPLEQLIIKLMLTNNDLIPKITEYKDVIWNPNHQKLFSLIENSYKDNGKVGIEEIKDSLDDKDFKIFDSIIETVQLGEKNEEILADIIEQIKYNKLIQRQNEIIEILDILDESNDNEQLNILSKELLEIQNLTKGNKFQGRRV